MASRIAFVFAYASECDNFSSHLQALPNVLGKAVVAKSGKGGFEVG